MQDVSNRSPQTGGIPDTLGFIGQGWIGKNLADHFQERGFNTVRYALTPRHLSNKEAVRHCRIVFIAVPTPTTPEGFDYSAVRSVLGLVGTGNIAVIKSTLLPGTTDRLQDEYSNIIIIHAPEFLREVSAREDVDEPQRNILGIPGSRYDDPRFKAAAQLVLSVLPAAAHTAVMTATEAETVKYATNNFLYSKVIFMNVLYEFAAASGARFDIVAESLAADSRIGASHMQPIHQYGHLGTAKSARGAGGHCFLKDFAAFTRLYRETLPAEGRSIAFLQAIEAKNIELLKKTEKDSDLLKNVYGETA